MNFVPDLAKVANRQQGWPSGLTPLELDDVGTTVWCRVAESIQTNLLKIWTASDFDNILALTQSLPFGWHMRHLKNLTSPTAYARSRVKSHIIQFGANETPLEMEHEDGNHELAYDDICDQVCKKMI